MTWARWTLSALAVFAVIAFFGWMASDAAAAPHPQEPPRRLSDIPCVRVLPFDPDATDVRVRAYANLPRCVRLLPWAPMTRGQ